MFLEKKYIYILNTCRKKKNIDKGLIIHKNIRKRLLPTNCLVSLKKSANKEATSTTWRLELRQRLLFFFFFSYQTPK